MNDKPQLLEQCGQVLYGVRWRTELAAALEVSERTVRRWSAGQFEIPDGAWGDVACLLVQRGRAIRDVEKLVRSIA